MATSKTSNGRRNQRNNPYRIEDWAVSLHRSPAGIAWRWRAEAALITATAIAYARLALTIGHVLAAIALAGGLGAALTVPWSRRFLARRTWCVIVRHRLQRVFYETRMHTRAGRLPLVLWIRPIRVGERAWILCRAGVCADDFDAYRPEIGSACYAREARITRHARWSHVVTVDIVRHDPLTPKAIIPSHVIPATRQRKESVT